MSNELRTMAHSSKLTTQSKKNKKSMNTTLTLILAVVCIIVATVLRNLVEKNLRRTAEENPEKYQKKLRNINIIRLVLTIGIIVFFTINLINDWQMGDKNYFNLALIIIMIVGSISVFSKRFKK